jgi:hypothetical protein
MPLTEDEIQPGKCYKTKGRDNYRVIAVTRGIVTYQTMTSPLRINVGIKQFADAVFREMPCPPK